MLRLWTYMMTSTVLVFSISKIWLIQPWRICTWTGYKKQWDSWKFSHSDSTLVADQQGLSDCSVFLLSRQHTIVPVHMISLSVANQPLNFAMPPQQAEAIQSSIINHTGWSNKTVRLQDYHEIIRCITWLYTTKRSSVPCMGPNSSPVYHELDSSWAAADLIHSIQYRLDPTAGLNVQSITNCKIQPKV